MSSSDQHEADNIGKSRYRPSHSITTSQKILNVIPMDFNHDGRMDLLVMTEEKEGSWWAGEKSRVRMQVHLGTEGGEFGEYPLSTRKRLTR